MKIPAPHTRAGMIISYLSKGPASSADIGEVIDLTSGETSSFMGELRKRGLVERAGAIKGKQGQPMALWDLTAGCRASVDQSEAGREASTGNRAAAAA